MRMIAMIVDDIREEMEGAEHYAKMASKYKETDRFMAETYAKLAEAELGHVNALHEQAVRLIKDQQSAGIQIPAGMKTVWDWEHEKMVDTVSRIKIMLNMYRAS